jgi:hypothetical protein
VCRRSLHRGVGQVRAAWRLFETRAMRRDDFGRWSSWRWLGRARAGSAAGVAGMLVVSVPAETEPQWSLARCAPSSGPTRTPQNPCCTAYTPNFSCPTLTSPCPSTLTARPKKFTLVRSQPHNHDAHHRVIRREFSMAIVLFEGLSYLHALGGNRDFCGIKFCKC